MTCTCTHTCIINYNFNINQLLKYLLLLLYRQVERVHLVTSFFAPPTKYSFFSFSFQTDVFVFPFQLFFFPSSYSHSIFVLQSYHQPALLFFLVSLTFVVLVFVTHFLHTLVVSLDQIYQHNIYIQFTSSLSYGLGWGTSCGKETPLVFIEKGAKVNTNV